jgi:acetyltransferase-like isoleucine patch superfamily enzyme
MLLYYDPMQPIYVIGDGVVAREICHWIKKSDEDHSEVVRVDPCSVDDIIKNGAQVMLGFMRLDYRIKMLARLGGLSLRWPTYIHPTAVVEHPYLMGRGTVICDLVHCGLETRAGDFCYFATGVQLSHGSSVGENCVLTPSVIIGGNSQIGNFVYVGQQGSIRDKITVCDDVKFAMNSVVTRSIEQPGCYVNCRKVEHIDL